MADNERQKRNFPPRKSLQYFRPPPAVQKAIQNLGVADLREILDKKRQEQGESQDKPDSNPPPPDPSYNFLKDSSRDRPSDRPKPSQTQNRSDIDKHPKRSDDNRYQKKFHNDTHQKWSDNDRHHQKRSDNNTHQKWFDNDGHHQKRSDNDRYQKPRDRDTTHLHWENVHEAKDRRQQDKENKLQGAPDKGVLKKIHKSPHDDSEPKKELRFVEPPKFEEHPTRGGRQSFRGRNARRGGGVPRESVEKKIENPINIKIELSTQTGQRNCILDENTKIADIKHVPDTPLQKYTRGGYRGSRSNFRSRGRGRGSFRGSEGFIARKGSEYSKDAKGLDNNFNNEKSQRPVHDDRVSRSAPTEKAENAHDESGNSSFEQNSQESSNTQSNEEHEDYDGNEEYDHDNEEYDDANEHYNEEYSNVYQSVYENAEHIQKLDDEGKCETNIIDPNLNETITITSSKFQDGEVKRSIDITENTNVTDEKQKEKDAEE